MCCSVVHKVKQHIQLDQTVRSRAEQVDPNIGDRIKNRAIYGKSKETVAQELAADSTKTELKTGLKHKLN